MFYGVKGHWRIVSLHPAPCEAQYMISRELITLASPSVKTVRVILPEVTLSLSQNTVDLGEL